MRKAFISGLIKAARKNPKIMLLTGDLGYRYLEPFKDAYPDRFINVGVAESNLITVASGLAAAGFEPFVYSIATFASLRAYEQIRNLIVLQNLNVKIVGTGGGLAYANAGVTHHSYEDIAAMRLLPNMTIAAPVNPQNTEDIISLMTIFKGPAYIRLERNPLVNVKPKTLAKVGKAQIIKKGRQVALLVTGTKLDLAFKLSDFLAKNKIQATISIFPFISPLDTKLLQKLGQTHTHFITLEEHRITGGFGTAVEKHVPRLLKLGLRDTFSSIASEYDHQLIHHAFDYKSAVKAVKKYLKNS